MKETVIYIFAIIGAGFSAFIVSIIIDAVFDLIKEGMERKCIASKGERARKAKEESMSLDEAIKHCEEKSNCTACGKEHAQFAEWLKELKRLREQIGGEQE